MGGKGVSLRFITGRSGAGKTTMIQQEIVEMLQDDPLGKPIIVIVPDQMSFSMEYSLSVNSGLKGIVRAQVLTFKRLAWHVLQEVGGITRNEVDGFGYRMLIRSVLEENEQQFKLFKQAANKRGFTEQISDLMKEFSRYAVDQDALSLIEEQLKAKGSPQILQDKAADLKLLLEKIEEKLGTTYVDSEGYLKLLVSQLAHSHFVKDAHIYIDGFENFTTREYSIIGELLKYSSRCTIVLPIDQMNADEQNLFANAIRTHDKIEQLAHMEGVEQEAPLHMSPGKRFKARELANLESQFEQYPAATTDSEGAITFIEAANQRAEVHAVARAIRRMAMEGKRYQDMAILYRQPEVYDELLETTFHHYEIPLFISRRKPMLHHPLIEFSRSVLEVLTNDWTFEAVFRAVKTDLFFPYNEDKKMWRERADRLENFVLERGIYGKKWFDESKWFVKRYRGLEFFNATQTDFELALQREIEAVRDAIRSPLEKLAKTLKKAKTGRAIAEAFFAFAEDLQIYEKIIHLRTEEEERGQLLKASEHEQAWNEWIHLLDQFVLMFGEKGMTLTEARKVLEEGFDSLEFTRIPPALDQVTVATIDLAKLMNTDVIFVMGVSEGVLPQRIDHEGILSDTEREIFTQIGYELAPTSKMRLMEETFMAYRAFTSAQEKLFISYAVADEEGKGLIPSLYIQRLQQIVRNCEVVPAVLDPSELPKAAHRLEYISHPRATLPFAVMKVEQRKEQPLTAEWQAVLTYYANDPLWKSIVQNIITPVQEGNQTERLAPELTTDLYGETISTSVSRIESYYSCPFQHFANYGLQLQERAEFTLQAPQIGDLFHAALKWVTDELNRLNMSWNEVTKEQSWQLAKQAVEDITPYFFNRILVSTSRYRYIQRKLIQIVQRTIQSMATHANRSKFKTIAVEQGFGPNEAMNSLVIPLRNGRELALRGRIDRIDVTEQDGQKYLRIVDYKSSKQELDLTKVYYGLSLQMLTYLDVALENAEQLIGEQAMPAGVLYMHVHNPMISTGEVLTQEKLEEELVKSYKMRGYLLDDAAIVEQMDEEIGSSSSVVPAAFKKDGNFTKASKVLEEQDLELLRQFVKTKHRQAGNGMLVGDTRVFPYKLKDKMPCEYCSFRSVCQFDEANPKQTYRQYEDLKQEQSLEKMREEMQNDEHSN